MEDLPGLGKFYCIECAKWFESEYGMVKHRKGKNHKRRYSGNALILLETFRSGAYLSRLRALRNEPYTQKEAEAAIGLTTDNGSRKPSALATLEEKAASLEVEMGNSR